MTHAIYQKDDRSKRYQQWNPADNLGWQYPRKVAYIHRHPLLNQQCLYHWNHQKKQPEPAKSQRMRFQLEDIYAERRGEFNSKKLILDLDLGLDGKLRLISGLCTIFSTSILASFCTLSPELLIATVELRVRPGTSQGVVMPSIFVEHEWVDGRPLKKDDKGQPVPASALLSEGQMLLRDGLNVELLPHELRSARLNNA